MDELRHLFNGAATGDMTVDNYRIIIGKQITRILSTANKKTETVYVCYDGGAFVLNMKPFFFVFTDTFIPENPADISDRYSHF